MAKTRRMPKGTLFPSHSVIVRQRQADRANDGDTIAADRVRLTQGPRHTPITTGEAPRYAQRLETLYPCGTSATVSGSAGHNLLAPRDDPRLKHRSGPQ